MELEGALREKDLDISRLLGEIQSLKRKNLTMKSEVDVLHQKLVTSEREHSILETQSNI